LPALVAVGMTLVTHAEPPVVIVTTVHVPFVVVVASAGFVIGVAFVVFCARRYRSTSDRVWAVLSVAAAVGALVSAAALVGYMVRTAG
jgi:uncharacterized protein (DUF849 family)